MSKVLGITTLRPCVSVLFQLVAFCEMIIIVDRFIWFSICIWYHLAIYVVKIVLFVSLYSVLWQKYELNYSEEICNIPLRALTQRPAARCKMASAGCDSANHFPPPEAGTLKWTNCGTCSNVQNTMGLDNTEADNPEVLAAFHCPGECTIAAKKVGSVISTFWELIISKGFYQILGHVENTTRVDRLAAWRYVFQPKLLRDKREQVYLREPSVLPEVPLWW